MLTQTKKCTKCGEVKPVGEFYKHCRNKSGLRSWCKTCVAAADSVRQKTPKFLEGQRARKRTPKYRAQQRAHQGTPEYLEGQRARQGSPKYLEKRRARQKTPKYQEKQRAYRQTPKFREKQRAYRQTPKYQEKQRASRRTPKFLEGLRNRYATDVEYRLRILLRVNMRRDLKRGEKANGSGVRDLGCSIPEFKMYIEAQFTNGMTWDNQGKYWHLDHIVALALAKLADREQFLLVAHWANYQPLLGPENMSKQDTPPSEGQRGWDRYQELLAIQRERVEELFPTACIPAPSSHTLYTETQAFCTA